MVLIKKNYDTHVRVLEKLNGLTTSDTTEYNSSHRAEGIYRVAGYFFHKHCLSETLCLSNSSIYSSRTVRHPLDRNP